MSKKKEPAKVNAEAAGVQPVASFYRWQLAGCKAIKAPYDVVMAVLKDDRTYTIEEAQNAINEFMNRKV